MLCCLDSSLDINYCVTVSYIHIVIVDINLMMMDSGLEVKSQTLSTDGVPNRGLNPGADPGFWKGEVGVGDKLAVAVRSSQVCASGGSGSETEGMPPRNF